MTSFIVTQTCIIASQKATYYQISIHIHICSCLICDARLTQASMDAQYKLLQATLSRLGGKGEAVCDFTAGKTGDAFAINLSVCSMDGCAEGGTPTR
jgi:hypothetical protein